MQSKGEKRRMPEMISMGFESDWHQVGRWTETLRHTFLQTSSN